MSTTRPPANSPPTQSFFEQQRALLLEEIAISFEHVLANINKLNRSLEGVIAVGNEFSSVEALWSQFENVMAKDPDAEAQGEHGEEGNGHANGHEAEDESTVLEREGHGAGRR